MRRTLAIGCCGVGLVVPAGAPAAGGPVPPLQGGAGVSAPGSDLGYVAVGVGRRTLVERVRRASGAVERWRLLPGSLGVAAVAYDGSSTGLSADGRTLVLAETIRRYPPAHTRLVVLDARRLRPRARIALPGYFAVDAISPTGRWLYLIHYTSARDATRYEVRAYDLRVRRLVARPVVDPREPDEAMRGIAVTRATSADGRWAYTLYDRPSGTPFIHALDTQRRTAACVDLPTLAAGNGSMRRLALDRGGATLRVVDASGPLALVDTRSFAVRRRPAAAPRPLPARRAGEGGGDGVRWPLAGAALATLVGLGLVGVRRRRHARSTPA